MSLTLTCPACFKTIATVSGSNVSLCGNATITGNFPPANWNSNWLKCSDCNRFTTTMNAAAAQQAQRLRDQARRDAEARRRADEAARLRAQQIQQQKQAQRNRLNRNIANLSTQLQQKGAAYNDAHRRWTQVNAQIASEERDIARFSVERADASTEVAIMLGMTGAGASTLCNRLEGDVSTLGNTGSFATSAGGQSCTQSNSKKIVRVGNHRITVVDTPGFNDSFGQDRTHSNRLCQYLRGCGGINAFVLVRNGANARFDASFQAMLREYHAMFGNAFFARLVIVATHVEGFVKMQFQQKALSDDIRNLFRLNHDIPVVPIGFDNGYAASLTTLANAIPNGKQQFQQIKSPIDELKSRRAAIANEKNNISAQKQNVQRELNRVQAELRAV